jgi:hypothetical protein
MWRLQAPAVADFLAMVPCAAPGAPPRDIAIGPADERVMAILHHFG